MKKLTTTKRRSFFTLIEIMIVIAIIGILAAIAVPKFTQYRTDSIEATRAENITMLNNAVKAWLIGNPDLADDAALVDDEVLNYCSKPLAEMVVGGQTPSLPATADLEATYAAAP